MTWLDFKNLVDDLLVVDAKRRGPGVQTYKEKLVRLGVINIQRTIEFYQLGHETLYEQGDVAAQGKASVGKIPAGADLQEAWLIRRDKDDPTKDCCKTELDFYPWVDREDLVCGRCGTPHSPSFTVSPQVDKFMISPIIQGREITVVSLTLAGSTVTATTDVAHGLLTTADVIIKNAVETEYNGTYEIVVTSPTQFTYTITGTPASPATTLSTITVQVDDDITSLLLVWNGTKLDFLDSDEVPFDEDMALPVSLYVKAGFEMQMTDTTADSVWTGKFRKEKGALYVDKKEAASVSRQRAHQHDPDRPRRSKSCSVSSDASSQRVEAATTALVALQGCCNDNATDIDVLQEDLRLTQIFVGILP